MRDFERVIMLRRKAEQGEESERVAGGDSLL